MFFNKLPSGIFGSKCPTIGASFNAAKNVKLTSAEGRDKLKNKVPFFKPVFPVSTYRLHKALFNIAKDEIIASAVLG